MKKMILACITGILLIGCSKDDCAVDDWVGTYVYESKCDSGDGEQIIQVDDNGNPIIIEEADIVILRGTEAGTIAFEDDILELEIPVEGCFVDFGFGTLDLDGDQLTVEDFDGVCKIYLRN